MKLLQRVLHTTVDTLRVDLRGRHTGDLDRRRGVIKVSLIGMASMTAVSLLQTGIVRHLPDPPVPGFNSDRVNTSDTAYQFGVPDGTITLASLALNIPLAALGGTNRATAAPWIPLVAAAKATAEAAASGWYFYQMPAKQKAWCVYCIAGAIASFTVLGLTLPEAQKAWRSMGSRV